GTRLAPESLSEHDRTVALAVQEVADELGVTPSQVALAWTMTKSRAVIPILGARRYDQLADNLGALDVVLSAEAAERLEAVTGFSPGFPENFIAETYRWVFGEANSRVDGRRDAARR
ncbi:MAG TPA: aldo/keto reductase, partial [Streptosporangiaceae bacterium]